MTQNTTTAFEMSQANELCRDLMDYKPWVYFLDFTLSALLGYAAVVVYLFAPNFSPWQIAAFFVAGFALFRAGLFMHEIVHMPAGKMRPFKIYWSCLYGIPMLTPAFMYKNHSDHHSRKYYGTVQDGEYQPFAHGSFWRLVGYFAQVLVLPAFGIVRFVILTPLSLLSPKIRLWVLAHASSYISNPRYVRKLPAGEKRAWWLVQELICCAIMTGLIAAVILGYIPLAIVFKMYLLTVFAILLNWIRNLAGHRFLSKGDPMSHLEQFHESVTLTGFSPVTFLLFPIGMRYHALHHLFPAMPYHNLEAAHERLLAALPANSSYHQTLFSGVGEVFALLFKTIRGGQQTAKA